MPVPLRHKKRLSKKDEALIIDTIGGWIGEHGKFPDDPEESAKALAEIMERAYQRDECYVLRCANCGDRITRLQWELFRFSDTYLCCELMSLQPV